MGSVDSEEARYRCRVMVGWLAVEHSMISLLQSARKEVWCRCRSRGSPARKREVQPERMGGAGRGIKIDIPRPGTSARHLIDDPDRHGQSFFNDIYQTTPRRRANRQQGRKGGYMRHWRCISGTLRRGVASKCMAKQEGSGLKYTTTATPQQPTTNIFTPRFIGWGL